MASRTSTPSEGEIVEANKTHSRSSSSSPINRHSRRVLYSRSPSPTASTAPGRTRRSRSRSPYREHRAERSKGSKRRHADDHYGRRDRDDPRRFRVRYEDSQDRLSHGASDRAFEDRRRRLPEERRRASSRSPPARERRERRDEARSKAPDQKDIPKAGSGHVKKQSVADQRDNTSTTIQLKSIAETDKNQITQDTGSDGIAQGPSFDLSSASDTVLDVETLREQKRRKWEAIRAKHREQPAPLLKQALDAGTDRGLVTITVDADSPQSAPEDLTQPASVPGTPGSRESRESTSAPVDFSVDSDLANAHAQENANLKDDEPSAADYEATMDMDDDKKRHDHRLKGEQSHQEAHKAPIQPNVVIEDAPPTQKRPNDFDMFADEDEDDDMSAPASKDTKLNGSGGIQASRALDVKTIDDWDDDQGYYKVILGELLDGRYHVQSNLGKGMFSAVVRAQDQVTQNLVAIKLIRSNESMRKAAAKEIGILEKLKQSDPDDRKHLIRLERSFEHKGHLCMVFENLHENLREVLKKFGRDVGIDLQAVRIYAQQIFKGLSLLSKCNILHADLKPDNILVNERRTLLKICDLGSAADASETEITPYLVSRFYRAPEIILGMPFDYAIDTWSIGCTLFELYTGKILFTGRSNNQMLRTIMECRGRFSTKMLRKAEFAGLHFDEQGLFRSVERDRVTGNDVVRILNFLKPTRDLKARLLGTTRDPDLNTFLDLLDKCLTLNPERRITANDALKHPFLARQT